MSNVFEIPSPPGFVAATMEPHVSDTSGSDPKVERLETPRRKRSDQGISLEDLDIGQSDSESEISRLNNGEYNGGVYFLASNCSF